MKRRVLVLLALLPALGACGSGEDAGPPPVPVVKPVYSPNGEPLSGGPLGHPSCPEALARWFDRIDAGHTGTIDLAAFLADAKRQFAAMDLNHDGEITPDELARYRGAYSADLRVAERGLDDDMLRPDQSAPPARDGGKGGGGLFGAGGAGPVGAGSGGPSPVLDKPRGLPGEDLGRPRHEDVTDPLAVVRDVPDPVMIADVKLKSRVTLAEFLAYEQQNFADLDRNRDGRLTKAELVRSCPKS